MIYCKPDVKAILGQVVHTHAPHQAVQFGNGKGAVMPCSWEGDDTGLTSHWPYITEFSGSSTCGLTAMLHMGYGTFI